MVMVMVVAVAARWQRRPAMAAGEVVAGAFDGGGSMSAFFNGGNGLRQGDGKRECNSTEAVAGGDGD